MKNIFELKQEIGVAKIMKELINLREINNKYAIGDEERMKTLLYTYQESILIMTGNNYIDGVQKLLGDNFNSYDYNHSNNRFGATLTNQVDIVIRENQRYIHNWESINNAN